MDELIELAIEKPRRLSGYKRAKLRSDFLAKDVFALEALVETLLKNLERAIRPDVTDHDRVRFQKMVADIRGHLNDDGRPSAPSMSDMRTAEQRGTKCQSRQ